MNNIAVPHGIQYDESQHTHLGYCEHGYDFEATAFKILGKNLWHIFFPFHAYELPMPPSYRNAPYKETLGILIFTCKDRSLLQEKFNHWVKSELLPLFNGS